MGAGRSEFSGNEAFEGRVTRSGTLIARPGQDVLPTEVRAAIVYHNSIANHQKIRFTRMAGQRKGLGNGQLIYGSGVPRSLK